jgi:AGZA family xanthine/uracil permease-like MFS transporter
VGAGVVPYTAIKAARGRWREPGISMRVLTAVFAVCFALHPVESWLGAK